MGPVRALVALSLCTVPCGCRAAPETAAPLASSPSTAAAETTIEGLFHIVWNSRPHYFVTDSRGTTTELLLSEEVTRAAGGPLQLNGKRVRVRGRSVPEPRGALQVTSIELQPEGV